MNITLTNSANKTIKSMHGLSLGIFPKTVELTEYMILTKDEILNNIFLEGATDGDSVNLEENGQSFSFRIISSKQDENGVTYEYTVE